MGLLPAALAEVLDNWIGRPESLAKDESTQLISLPSSIIAWAIESFKETYLNFVSNI